MAGKMAGKSDSAGLVVAISAALADQGVPDGSVVDVSGGPAEGLVFTVGEEDAPGE
jgi:hypothetical protein